MERLAWVTIFFCGKYYLFCYGAVLNAAEDLIEKFLKKNAQRLPLEERLEGKTLLWKIVGMLNIYI